MNIAFLITPFQGFDRISIITKHGCAMLFGYYALSGLESKP